MKIERVFVVGSGLMGGGITQVSAQAGYKVTMHDVKQEFCDKGLEAIKFSLGKFLQKEKISQDHHDAALSNISTTTRLETCWRWHNTRCTRSRTSSRCR